MTPTYRNPNNDPPKLGEMIHFVRNGREEYPAVVNGEAAQGSGEFSIGVLAPWGYEARAIIFDAYDPTPDPSAFSWHFHHLT